MPIQTLESEFTDIFEKKPNLLNFMQGDVVKAGPLETFITSIPFIVVFGFFKSHVFCQKL